jgi:hypothetical protein
MDGFVPDELLASLVSSRHAERVGCVLRTRDGRRYALEDAVRVIGCARERTDPYGMIGIVESLGSLVRRGFVVSSRQIALNRVVYDVELGVLAHPLTDADETGVNARVS